MTNLYLRLLAALVFSPLLIEAQQHGGVSDDEGPAFIARVDLLRPDGAAVFKIDENEEYLMRVSFSSPATDDGSVCMNIIDKREIDSRVERQITGEALLLDAATGDNTPSHCVPFKRGQRRVQQYVKFTVLKKGIVFVTAQCEGYPHDDDAISQPLRLVGE
jgi:hypothetical protein